MSFDLDQPIALRTDDIVWRGVDDELIVLQVSTASYLTLNRAGQILWPQLVGETTTVAQLADTLVTRFRIERERAITDVNAFLAELEERSLICATG